MQSLLAAGSAIGQRMLGIITRSPRVLLSSSPHQQVTVRPTTLHHGETFPDFNNCDCHFGKRADSGRSKGLKELLQEERTPDTSIHTLTRRATGPPPPPS